MRKELAQALGIGACVVALAALPSRRASSQALPGLTVGPVLPATCGQGASYLLTTGQAALYVCTATNTWATISGIPAGAILLVTAGSCPSDYAEVTALNGRMVRGTLAANGNVGTTSGSDAVTPTFTGNAIASTAVSAGTPAGTNSAPTFSGSALASHAHELPWQIPSTTTSRQIAVATFGQGTSRAATAVSAAGTATTTSAAVALSQAVTAGMPAGTVTAPTFTGSALGTHQHTTTATGTISAVDTRSAYTHVLFCQKS